MKLNAEFFFSPPGLWAVLAAALLAGGGAILWQHHRHQPILLGTSLPKLPAAMPKVFTRDVARFPETKGGASPLTSSEASTRRPEATTPPTKPVTLPAPTPLTLFAAPAVDVRPEHPFAPYGRLIPCETVISLESNHLETPVIGLVTDNVWNDGRIVIPCGAEVHGRAALDPNRERIAASGAWVIVWRTHDRDNGSELAVTGIALDRDFDPVTGRRNETDGSAGLRGTLVKTQDDRELKLFASAFLGAATAALQDTRSAAGLLGEASIPVASARNGTLAGIGAILREQTQQMRDAIARDGFYLRIPGGKPFYLYLTEAVDLGRLRKSGTNPVHS